MFSKKSGNEYVSSKIGSEIGADTVIEGNLRAKETARIDGVVKGDVMSEGNLIIGPNGKVSGNITAANIMVGGEVNGDITSAGKIEFAATARVFGNIKTKSLVVDENAVFQGQCGMTSGGGQPQLAGSKPEALPESVEQAPAKADPLEHNAKKQETKA